MFSDFSSRLLCAKPKAPTQLGENEHGDHHFPIESHVVITTDPRPINSRARGAGWVAWFSFDLREGLASVGSAKRHRGVAGRSYPNLACSDRPLALVQTGSCGALSEVNARRHRRHSRASADSNSAAKGPGLFQKPNALILERVKKGNFMNRFISFPSI